MAYQLLTRCIAFMEVFIYGYLFVYVFLLLGLTNKPISRPCIYFRDVHSINTVHRHSYPQVWSLSREFQFYEINNSEDLNSCYLIISSSKPQFIFSIKFHYLFHVTFIISVWTNIYVTIRTKRPHYMTRNQIPWTVPYCFVPGSYFITFLVLVFIDTYHHIHSYPAPYWPEVAVKKE